MTEPTPSQNRRFAFTMAPISGTFAYLSLSGLLHYTNTKAAILQAQLSKSDISDATMKAASEMATKMASPSEFYQGMAYAALAGFSGFCAYYYGQNKGSSP